MIGANKPHPWLKLTPVFKLWFMEREFLGSILERQRDTTSVMITGFHQSLIAENYKFLAGIYACELIQHNVEENHHETWSKEGYWRQHINRYKIINIISFKLDFSFHTEKLFCEIPGYYFLGGLMCNASIIIFYIG